MMPGVIPGIAEVKVKDDSEASSMATFCKLHVVCKVIVPAWGIDPYALANDVHTAVLKNCLRAWVAPAAFCISFQMPLQ